jgi:hypothetical protein
MMSGDKRRKAFENSQEGGFHLGLAPPEQHLEGGYVGKLASCKKGAALDQGSLRSHYSSGQNGA